MAKARIEFSGDAAELAKAYQQLRKEADSFRDANIKLARESRQHHDDKKSHLSEEISGLKSHITHLFSLTAAVHLAREAYEEWREEIRELAKEAEAGQKVVASTIAAVGNLPRGREVEAFIDIGPGLEEDRAAALRGAHRGDPLASLDQQKAVAERVSEVVALSGKQLFPDPEKAAETVATLQKISPSTPVKDIVDVTLATQQGPGGDQILSDANIRTIRGLVETGATDLKDAIALVQAALEKQVPEKVLETIASKVEEPGTAPTHVRGRRLTEQEQYTQKLSEMKPTERLEALRTDKEMQRALGFGDKAITQLGALDDKTIAEIRRRLDAADRAEFRLTAPEQLRRTEAGGEVIRRYGLAERKQDAYREKETEASRMEDLETEIDIRMKDSWFITRWLNKKLVLPLVQGAEALVSKAEDRPATGESMARALGATPSELQEIQDPTKELRDLLRRQLEEQQRTNDLIERGMVPPPADASAHRE